MTPLEIAKAFSCGQFESCFPYISEHAIWHTPGSHRLVGRAAIEHHCRHISTYFESVDTHFQILQVLDNGLSIALTGTAQFYRDEQLINNVNACDVYTFNAHHQLVTITSYCVSEMPS